MVGPGALKPKVGDGIKSRRPFSAPVLHSFILLFFLCLLLHLYWCVYNNNNNNYVQHYGMCSARIDIHNK